MQTNPPVSFARSIGVIVSVLLILIFMFALGAAGPAAQRPGAERLLIRNATLVDGSGSPARGPVDIQVDDGVVESVVAVDPVSLSGGAKRPTTGRVIDAEGMYVLPGLIDMHVHIPSDKTPYGPDYAYKLWLAHGITTVRDAGCFGGFDMVVKHRDESARGQRVAPRIFAYRVFPFDGIRDGDAGRARVKQYKAEGADGIKMPGLFPDLLQPVAAEARAAGLPIMQHNSIALRGSGTILDSARAGITSVEHWYGVPEAALPDGQDLPADYNELDELHRFRWAGRLWQQADRALMDQAITVMVEHGVSWDPTFAVYEANRDLLRAKSLPWHDRYTHPDLYRGWLPNPAHHGSFHSEWTSVDEAMWRQDIQIWMETVHRFAGAGGVVTAGSDAGSNFHLYGFGYVRELEAQVEAGFRPLEVIRHATGNAGKVLGVDRLGQIRPGWIADMIVVPRNPLADFKALYGDFGTGGVRWTIKAGRVFDAPALLKEVRDQVQAARRGTR